MSFRSARKLSNYLLRAKIYPNERSIGTFKYDKKRYKVYENVNKLKTLLLQFHKKNINSITD